MTIDLVSGQISKFRLEQGFGTITLADGRQIPFDASICAMVPQEGDAVRVRVGKAKWGGGEKAVHVEPLAAGSGPLGQAVGPTLEHQLGTLQAAHLISELSEEVLAGLKAELGADASLLDLIDAYYSALPERARHDGYLRHDWRFGQETDDVMAELASLLPDSRLPRQIRWSQRETTEHGHAETISTIHLAMPDEGERALDVRSLHDIIMLVNEILDAAGDARRLYALETGGDWHAYFALTRDRAKQVHPVLPFTTAP